MARIPDAEIERLKSEVSVERLVTGAGIELQRAGKDLLGACPFHEDAKPSLVVTPAKNLWHCFGCQSGGGPIDWVMRLRGVSFRHAVELLREGIPPLAATPVKHSTVRALPAPVAREADDQALLTQVVDYYHETLKQSPEALAYLAARGLDHPELVAQFRLGYANRTLGLRLPDKRRKEGAELRTRLETLGLYRASGHEHFNGSLVVPVLDAQGQVTEIYGRKLRDDLRPGTPLHLYLPGPHRGVWNVAALQASREIILCEALLDAMTFWCAGYRNVTTSYGIEGFTADHLAAFQQHGTERVLIAYDRDEPGERAAAKLAEKLMAAGIECWRIEFPKGMDANEYALKVQPAVKSLGLAIRKAIWLGKGTAPVRTVEGLPTVAASAPVESTSPLAAKEAAPPAPLPASPLPPAPALDVPAELRQNEVVLTFGERRYRVRGLAKNLAYEVLKVNLLASVGEAFYVDTLDLYSAKARASYLAHAAIELRLGEDILKSDLGRVLLKLEALQDAQIQQATAPVPPTPAMDDDARRAARALLQAPDLIERILADFATCGSVGERTNKLTAYLAAVSRKLDRPLAVVIQSSSAAGKSALMDAVLAFLPEEERSKYSAMTGQALFYMGATNLKHKVLAIVEEEGASRASYALKLLQSEGELTIASTGKDPASGNLVAQEYRVEGPVMVFLTTTAITMDEELLNRCLVLAVDEQRTQTQAIHRRQRTQRTLAGLALRQQREELLTLHRNVQRLLRPLAVVNPYADALTFPDASTRLRRDHDKYLTLIDAIALLHQYQRPVRTLHQHGRSIEYIEVTPADIALANDLAHEVLGRSLDELPPQTRRLLGELATLYTERARTLGLPRTELRLARRELRAALGWGDTQLKVHLARLVELEYLLAHRAPHGQGLLYELLYDGDGQRAAHLSGLIDAQTLTYDAARSGLEATRSAPGRGAVGVRSASGRSEPLPETAGVARLSEAATAPAAPAHGTKPNGKTRSYPQAIPLAAS